MYKKWRLGELVVATGTKDGGKNIRYTDDPDGLRLPQNTRSDYQYHQDQRRADNNVFYRLGNFQRAFIYIGTVRRR